MVPDVSFAQAIKCNGVYIQNYNIQVPTDVKGIYFLLLPGFNYTWSRKKNGFETT
jgi:hypothetical protein